MMLLAGADPAAKDRDWRARISRALRKNYQGKRFGRLLALARVAPSRWLCLCDCGTHTTKWQQHLVTGRTRSCGCIRRVR